jgi:hypothetical protein
VAETLSEYQARVRRREVRLLRLRELAKRLNGRAVMNEYIRCNGQGSGSTGWGTDQFERWLIGVMRKALTAPTEFAEDWAGTAACEPSATLNPGPELTAVYARAFTEAEATGVPVKVRVRLTDGDRGLGFMETWVQPLATAGQWEFVRGADGTEVPVRTGVGMPDYDAESFATAVRQECDALWPNC